ncbi:o-acyltransferase like protein [Caerostris darwini]|uniref:O-acyltransferase like protein n=1 Tax=Caerostris darwini TaxID=1538125 RepID=A0AAV4V4B6_9ARAC|nr:o-acyltransferase like protein [Caerostris darwini]
MTFKKYCAIFLLLFGFLIATTRCSTDVNAKIGTQKQSKMKEILSMISNALNIDDEGINHTLEFFKKITDFTNFDESSRNSTECLEDFLYVLELLKEGDLEAEKMFDSYGKPGSGIMSGNINWVGSYNECRNVTVPVLKNTTRGGFKGQYCQLGINLLPDSYNFPVKVGTCLPDTCDSSNVIAVLNTIVHKEEFQSFFSEKLRVDFQNRRAEVFSRIHRSHTVVLVVGACCGIGALLTLYSRPPIKEKDFCVLKETSVNKTNNIEMSSLPNIENNGTSINGTSEDSAISCSNSEGERSVTNEVRCVEDVPQVEEDKQDSATSSSNSEGECSATNEVRCVEDGPQIEEEKKERRIFLKFFLCFCPVTNAKKMEITAQNQRPVLNGLRSFASAWVVLCHTFSWSLTLVGNSVEALSMADNLWYQVILNGFYSVDIFFVMSGYFLATSFFSSAPKNRILKFFLMMIFRRLIRLLPLYAFTIFFFVTCFPHLASGPFWPHNAGTCKDNWWTNLLFVNNLSAAGAQCMPWTWYMPCDFQYFAFSLPLLYVLRRCPKLGKTLIFGLICASSAYVFYKTYENNLFTGPANNLFTGPANNLDFAAKNPGVFMVDVLYFSVNFVILNKKSSSPRSHGGVFHAEIRPTDVLGGSPGPQLCLSGLLLQSGKNVFETNKVASYAMDAATLTVALLCIFGLHLFGKDISLIGACFYNSSHHLLFSLCVAWFLFKCETGQAGRFLLWIGILVIFSCQTSLITL